MYVKAPDGSIVEIADADAQRASNQGYTSLSPEEYDSAVAQDRAQLAPEEQAQKGLIEQAPGQEGTEFTARAVAGATFGLGAEHDPMARASARQYEEQHPGAALAADALGQLPGAVLGAEVGTGLRAALGEGAGLLGRGAAFAGDLGVNAAVAGAQIEEQRAREAGERFSITDAAVNGAVAEVLGRSAAWGVSRGVGGARNLLARAEQQAVKRDAARSLETGSWFKDYQVAAHAEAYHDELAELAAKDLDKLETSFAEVSRQDRKRARIERSVIDNPPVQRELNAGALDDLTRLRSALAGELADAGSGPAKRLAKQLDERIAALEEAPRGKKLWRLLDENRQALQEYRQDLYQAYDANPGSAWLSREGLAAIDKAEEATRNALLREDAWGEAAARMQREYNQPFHEQWFPARNTVQRDLYFATGKDAKGFPVLRGEPAKVRKFLTSLNELGGPDAHLLRAQFGQYLDGAIAVAKAGERDAPRAARDVQEAARRLRKAMANAQAISGAAERTATRTGAVDAAVGVGAAVAGAAAYGPAGALAGPAAKGLHVSKWLGKAANALGLGAGERLSMEKLLGQGALHEVDEAAHAAARAADDVAEATVPRAPFPPAEPPAAPAGAIAPQPVRGVGAPEARGPSTSPGLGNARRAAADRPAGMEAIQPQPAPRAVGEAASREPGGWTPMERPSRDSIPGGAGESGLPSMREGSEVPMAGARTPPPLDEAAVAGERETFPAPYRTEGMAESEKALAPGADARAAEAKRLQALTEGEFRDVVGGLRASGDESAKALADSLWANREKLLGAGLVVAGAADAAFGEHAGQFSGASAAGLGVGIAFGRRVPNWLLEHTPAVRGAVEKLAELGFEVQRPHAVLLQKTFGDKLSAEALGKAMPLELLKGLAPMGAKPELMRTGNELVWAAEGVSTMHPEWGFEAPTWKIGRAFERGPSGELIAKHDYFYIRDDLQGTGVGAKVLKSQMEAYRALGVHQVEVSCDDVGKYFWPSIGFNHPDQRVVQKAVNAYQDWVVQNKLQLPSAVAAEARTIKSLPRLAQAEFGKDFLLAKKGEWNMHLEIKLDDSNPLFHLMSQRLGLADAGMAAAGLALVGQIEGNSKDSGTGSASAAAAPFLLFGRRAGAMREARTKLVATVARKLFAEYAPKLAGRAAVQAYSRADLAKRRQEFEGWAQNPAELVDRVATGFREVPPEHRADVYGTTFAAATFLQEKMPRPAAAQGANAINVREVPVSNEALAKYARYEQATLRPGEALQDAAQRGHFSTELLETLGELYPDLLNDLRAQAYLTVRERGAPPSVQAKLAYAQLFDGRGETADPAFSTDVARMAAYAYEMTPPITPGKSSGGGGSVDPKGLRPAGLARLG